MVLLMFVLFGCAHESFYQRISWLALAVLLVQPFSLGAYGLNSKTAFRRH